MSTIVKTLKLLFLRLNRAAGQNQDYWPFFQLEYCITYKAQVAGVVVEKVPAASTTKSCHRCGQLHPRKKHVYRCARCGRQAHADTKATAWVSPPVKHYVTKNRFSLRED